MALKAALYRGPSSRLETLIEKIQANNKELNSDACSVHTTSPSFSPSISERIHNPTLNDGNHNKYFAENITNGFLSNQNNNYYYEEQRLKQQQQQELARLKRPNQYFSLSDDEVTPERDISYIEEAERSYSLPPSFLSPSLASISMLNKGNRRPNRKQRQLLLNNSKSKSRHYNLRRPINRDLMDFNCIENDDITNHSVKIRNRDNADLEDIDDIDDDDDDDDATRTTTTTTTTTNSETLRKDNEDDDSKCFSLRSGSQKRKRLDTEDENIKTNHKYLNNNDNSSNNNNLELANANSKEFLLKDILKKNAKLANKTKVGKNASNNKINGNSKLNDSPTDGSYQCQFCDKSFPRLGYLKKHEQSHAEHLPFKCEYCARLFKHKRSRDRHTKLHTGDRRYRCPHCEAAFSRSDHLKIHMKTHDNQKPFQCTICNRGYNTAAALTSHIQNHKKQAALLGTGLQPLNYSPRSTGSTSSSAGSFFIKQHQKSPLSMSGTDYGSNTGSPIRNDSKLSMHNQSLACLYCTQNNFNDLEQLNCHIQASHKNISSSNRSLNANESLSNDGTQRLRIPTPSTPIARSALTPNTTPQALTPIPNAISNFPMTCDYCTMKFTNISAMLQHMKAAHIDQMTLSSFDHFESLSNSFGFNSNFRSSPSLNAPQASAILNDSFDNVEIKKENPSPNSLKQSDADNGNCLVAAEKDENSMQMRPTDLSQPKRSHINQITENNDLLAREATTVSDKFFQRTFLCNQCNEALPDFHSFRNHLKIHITQKIGMICQHCGITLHDKNEYERHVMSHFLMTTSEFQCAKACKKIFSKVDDLRNHLFDQHSQVVYKCTLCAEIFDTKIAIQVHLSCTHVNETKTYQCTACMKQFRNEDDFIVHVKSHLTPPNGYIQCMFCRTICTSQLEMHFHLAAHTQQFRCPSCPETFQVEFLLERHLQTHHALRKESAQEIANGPKRAAEESDQYNKLQQQQQQQRQSPSSFSSAAKNLFQMPHSIALKSNKFFTPTPTSFNANNKQQSKYVANPRFDSKKSLLNLMYSNYHYNQQQQQQQQQQHMHQQQFHDEKQNNNSFGLGSGFLLSPTTYFDNNYDNMTTTAAAAAAIATTKRARANSIENQAATKPSNQSSEKKQIGFSCGLCERNDFRTEAEVNTHRKIVHNLKTGVSLRCAYCSGNFKSRSELEHHMKACHNSMGKHKCLICDEIFPSPAILAEHKLQHSRVGRSGKCVHCGAALNDITAFKMHLSKHTPATNDPIPIQCICCRQTLNSDFEVELHARYHTKTQNAPENGCVLCLEPLTTSTQSRLCEKCELKHKMNLSNCSVSSTLSSIIASAAAKNTNRFAQMQQDFAELSENKCNLCKIVLPHEQRLQEHLVEHTFAGCEERGYSCYICSSVFTVPGGLLNHMNEHGRNARPYDCNICQEKFFFRAELDHHLIKHQLYDASELKASEAQLQMQSTALDMIKTKEAIKNFHQQAQPSNHRGTPNEQKTERNIIKEEQQHHQQSRLNETNSKNPSRSECNDFKLQNAGDILKTEIKIENKSNESIDSQPHQSQPNSRQTREKDFNDEDEYIEIEKVHETTTTTSSSSVQNN